ncbi:MAG: DUF3971 domain-containing protein [Alphaproteobacteria bacterium]
MLLWVRLAQGPISLNRYLPKIQQVIEAKLEQQDAVAGKISLKGAAINWQGPTHPLQISLEKLWYQPASGALEANVEQLEIWLSSKALLRGKSPLIKLGMVKPVVKLKDNISQLFNPHGDAVIIPTDSTVGSVDQWKKLFTAYDFELLQKQWPNNLRDVTILEAQIETREGVDWHFSIQSTQQFDHGVLKSLSLHLSDLQAGENGHTAFILLEAQEKHATLSGKFDHFPMGKLLQLWGVHNNPTAAEKNITLDTQTLDGYWRFKTMLGQGLIQAEAALDVSLGDGVAFPVPNLVKPVFIKKARVTANLFNEEGSVNLWADLGGPTFFLETIHHPQQTNVLVHAQLHDITPQRVVDLWPVNLGRNARSWVAERINNGIVTEANAEFQLTANFAIEQLKAGFSYRGFSVDYLPPLPAATNVDGHATLENGDALVFVLDKGNVGDISLNGSGITISGLSKDAEKLDTKLRIKGRAEDITSFIDRPPLGYMKALGFKPSSLSGETEGVLSIALPLLSSLSLKDVNIKADAVIKDLMISDMLPGDPLKTKKATLALNNKGLNIDGVMQWGKHQFSANWQENFAPASSRLMKASGQFPAAEIADLLAAPSLTLGGQIQGNLVMEKKLNMPEEWHIDADLTDTQIDYQLFPFHKAAGIAGNMSLLWTHSDGETSEEINIVQMKAPQLDIAGQIWLDAKNKKVIQARFPNIQLGKSQLVVQALARRNGQLRIDVRGKVLDASGLLTKIKTSANAQDTKEAQSQSINVEVEKLLLYKESAWQNLRANIVMDSALRLLDIEAQKAPLLPLSVRYEPAVFLLDMAVGNLGDVLASLGYKKTIADGRLKIISTSQVKENSETGEWGSVQLDDFVVLDVPVLARLLNAVSATGLIDLFSGSGLHVESLKAAFRQVQAGGKEYQVKDGVMRAPSLSLTFAGFLKDQFESLSLTGTLTPIASINGLLDQTPLLGTLLTGGEGEGILAFTYSLQGKSTDPILSVNPLSGFMPGILRKLFFPTSNPEHK